MQVPCLLLALLAFALAADFNIDCTTANNVAPTLTTGCSSTYRVVNSTSRGVGVDEAWAEWLEFCFYGGAITVSPGDSIIFSGDCTVDTGMFFQTADFNGTLTFTTDAANPTTLNCNPQIYFFQGTNANGNTDATFIFENFIFTTENGYNGESSFYVEDGNYVFNNLVLDGYLISNPFIYAITNSVQRSITINTMDVSGAYPGNAYPNDEFIQISGEASCDLIINDLSVHDTRMNTMVYVTGGGPVFQLNNIVWDTVESNNGQANILQLQENSGIADFDVVIDGLTVTDLTFTAEAVRTALVDWQPNQDVSVDGTFTMSNVAVSGVTIPFLGTSLFTIAGRESVDISSFSVTDTTVNGWFNYATISGFIYRQSALNIDYTDGATLTDANFTGNSGFVWGALVTGYNTVNTVVSNAVFDSNTGSSQQTFLSRGGAAHLLGSTSFNNANFNLNTAEIGGAVYINNCDAYFTGCTFTNNTASVARNQPYTTGAGGAVLKNLEGAVFFDTCSFEFNTATHGGGALAFIQDEKLDDDQTNHRNGGDLFISNSVFAQNTAEYGGAIYWIARDMIVQDTNFTLNTAQTGGAVTAKDVNPFVSSPILFTNVRFEENTATGGVIQGLELQDGGAVSSERNTQFSKGLFARNVAVDGNGGAVTAYKGFNAAYTLFTENSALGVGGAIWSNPTQPQPLRLFRSDFVSNTAGGDGGAVWTNNPQTQLDGTSFTSNTAGGFGGAAFLATQATVTGSGFVQNNATSGGAIYSIGDAVISDSRFDSNVAQQDGGAIDCLSNPLGAVDFTLVTARNFFVNNQAVAGVGAHVHSTCTASDVGSTFTLARIDASLNQSSYECVGDLRVLRACELSFTNTKFDQDSLAVWAPAVPLQPFSSGLVLTSVTATTFTMYSQAETTTITGSTFEQYSITYENTPTVSTGNKFTNGDEECLSGPFTFENNVYNSATIHVFDQASFTNSQFDASTLTSDSAISLTDVTAVDGSSFDLQGPATLKRVTVDETSQTVTHQQTTAADVTVGAYTQLTGSLVLDGTFTCGGEGLAVEIAVDVSGNGDFVFVDGEFLNSAGSWTGDGALNLEAGTATFKVTGGGVVSRATEAGADVVVDGAGGLSLDAEFNAQGTFVLADDATITGTSNGALNLHKLVTFGLDNQIGVNTVAYSDALWAIMDKNTFSSVAFQGDATFNWPTNSTWTAHDIRTFIYWDQDFGNGTVLDSDYGNAFPIIVLTAPLDTNKYNCHSPVDNVVYEYDAVVDGEAVVIRYPEDGAGRPFENNPAYVTCNNLESVGPQATLTLYSGASVIQPFGLLLVLVLALLF